MLKENDPNQSEGICLKKIRVPLMVRSLNRFIMRDNNRKVRVCVCSDSEIKKEKTRHHAG